MFQKKDVTPIQYLQDVFKLIREARGASYSYRQLFSDAAVASRLVSTETAAQDCAKFHAALGGSREDREAYEIPERYLLPYLEDHEATGRRTLPGIVRKVRTFHRPARQMTAR